MLPHEILGRRDFVGRVVFLLVVGTSEGTLLAAAQNAPKPQRSEAHSPQRHQLAAIDGLHA
jgi:hypothetical protein